jgi:hypothetical protein
MKYLHHFLSVMILFLFTLLGNMSITFSQWQNDVRLTNDPGWSTTSFNNAWCISGSGDTVHIVWYDNRDGNYEIYYKRSVDGGSNWESDLRLTNHSASSEMPSISVSGSFVHIVWYDFRDGNNEIYYNRSTDSGTSWGLDTRLTNQSSNSDYPCISASGNNVNIVWRDGRDNNWEIYYKNSTDGGLSWNADTRLTNSNSQLRTNPSICVNNANVHVSWYDFRDGNGEIYYKRSTDAGINWGMDTRLTNNSASSISPSIAVSNSYVHIVFQDDRDGAHKIFYLRSTDDGINWEQEISLTEDDSSFLPSVAISSLNVHLVWAFEYPLNREIFYKRSTDGGSTWEENVRLTNAPSEGWLPSVSVSGSIVHILWRDGRDGNYEIYYKQNPTGNVTVIEDNITTPPIAFKLEQNYPNPFNPRTVISYQLPVNINVSLLIYDILGNEVASLVDEVKSAGIYKVEFNSNGLTSGIYFYTLQAGSFVETKKLVLLR